MDRGMKKRGVLLGMLAATAIVGSVGEAAATVTVTLRKTGVRRPRPLRHEVDSAFHHQTLRPADIGKACRPATRLS